MKKIEDSNNKLYGNYAVLFVGFEKDNHDKLIDTVKNYNNSMKILFAKSEDTEKSLKDVFSQENLYGYNNESLSTKAVIMSGFKENEIVSFMKLIRSLGFDKNLWAVLTPTSKDWSLTDLLKELEEESKAMKKLRNTR